MKPHMQTTIETLLRAGRSQREIERVTGIDRKTIRSYQKRLMAPPANSPRGGHRRSTGIAPAPATGHAADTGHACGRRRG